MLLHELKDLVRTHRLTGCSHMNKRDIMERLISHGIISKMEIILPNPTENYVGQKKKRDRDHTYLKNIRKNSKCVELKNIDTNEVHILPSIYRAAKFLNVNPGLVCYRYRDHKRIQNYEINIVQSE